jgi:peptide/nickel transport system permease protein
MYFKYLIKRILNGLLIYIILIFIYSLLFNTTSDSTARYKIDEEIHQEISKLKNMPPAQVLAFIAERKSQKIKEYWLDKPFMYRVYYRTLKILCFDFGDSTIIRSSSGERKVAAIVSETIPRTIILFSTTILFEVAFALWLGLKKAQKAGKMLDKATSLLTMIVFGMPSWWLGMLMIMFFSYGIPIFPSGGLHSVPAPTGAIASLLDLIYHMMLPLLTLFIMGFWGMAFLTRNIVLGILQEDYIMAARARGIPEFKVLYGHTLRAAAPPITTMALLALLASIGGNIVFEGIFNWPGMGNLYWIALEQNDIPVLLGLLAVTTGIYQAGLVFLDLIYGFLDPRIKVGGKA